MTGLLKTKIKKFLQKSPLGRVTFKLLRLLWHPLRRLFGRIDLLYLDVTHACNLRCITCPTDAGVPKQGELTLEEKKSIIMQAKKMGAKTVPLCGSGEPLLYKDILPLVDYITGLDMATVIFTNGTHVTPETAEFLITRNVEVCFKLWSFETAVIDRMVGVENAYEWTDFSYTYNGISRSVRIPCGLKYLLDSAEKHNRRYLVNIEVLITKINYTSVIEVVRFCKEMHLGLWLETILLSGRAVENYDEIALDGAQYQALYCQLLKIVGTKYLQQCRRKGCVVEKNPVVSDDGEMGFCSARTASIGNVRDLPLKVLFSRARRLKCKQDRLIPKRKLKSRYFRTCTARQFHHTRLKIPIEY
jgi:MoaA/NifB/PqqE/SkfB family radical SAM enzyme